jgi:hypothetical protein
MAFAAGRDPETALTETPATQVARHATCLRIVKPTLRSVWNRCLRDACAHWRSHDEPQVARKSRPAEPKLFVLDTNVLLHDPMCLFRFEEHDIFLPMIVLEELDSTQEGHDRGRAQCAADQPLA